MADRIDTHTLNLTLKKFSIDLSQFSDPTFDGICDSELQPFLQWLCRNLDENNVLPVDEVENYHKQVVDNEEEVFSEKTNCIVEELNLGCDDTYAEKSLERRLQKAEANLSKVRDLEKIMSEKEKIILSTHNKARDNLVKKVSQCLTEDLIAASNETLVSCSLLEPVVPKFDEYSTVKSEVYKELESLHRVYIDLFEKRREEEFQSLLPEIEDLQDKLVNAVFRRKTNERALQVYSAKLDTTIVVRDPPILEDIYEDVSMEIKRRKINNLNRDLDAYCYLLSTLDIYRTLALRHLANSLAFHGALEERLDYLDQLHKLTSDFASSISEDANNLNQCVALFSEDPKSGNSDGADTVDSLSSHNEVQGNCDLRRPSAICTLLLEPTMKELVLSKSLYRVAGRMLSELRTGPTLQLNVVPVPLLALLSQCRQKRNTRNSKLNQVLHCYVKFKESLSKDRDWPIKQLWVDFLLRSSTLLPTLDNPLSSLSRSRAGESMLNISFASSANSTRT